MSCACGKQFRDVAEGDNQITVSGYVKDVEFDWGTVTIAWGDGSTTSATYPCTAPCAFGTTSTFSEVVPCIGCTDRQYFAFQHTYLDDPTSGDDRYTITVTANEALRRRSAHRPRAEPEPTVTASQPSLAGYPFEPVTVSGTVTDPADPAKVSVDWGDGSAKRS